MEEEDEGLIASGMAMVKSSEGGLSMDGFRGRSSSFFGFDAWFGEREREVDVT